MRILIAIPLLVLLVMFALSNQSPVRLGLWPTDIQLDLPLSVAVLVAAGVFFVVGAFMTWGGSLTLRSRAHRAEQMVRRLEEQVEALRSQQLGTQLQPGMIQTGTYQSGALLPPPR